MSNEPVYLDAAGGTPMRIEALTAMETARGAFADPRAAHRQGREARDVLEQARGDVAAAIGADPDETVLTTGGAHANALAILGVRRAARGRIVTSTLEHRSVAEAASASGLEVVEVGTDEFGRVDVDRWAAEVARPATILASLQHASQDLGTMQPLAECARLAREHGVLMHADACQALPSLPVDAKALGVDLLSVSARKAYGPPGAGALYVRRGFDVDPFLRGEARPHAAWPRPNVAAAAAMAGALHALRPEIPDLAGRLWALSERLRRGLAEADPAIRVLGHPTHRLPHIVSWSVVGIDPETLFMALEDRGILAGAGRSSVLARAGLVEAGAAVVRLGLWRETSEDDVDRVVAAVPDIVGRLRGMAARVATVDGSPRER